MHANSQIQCVRTGRKTALPCCSSRGTEPSNFHMQPQLSVAVESYMQKQSRVLDLHFSCDFFLFFVSMSAIKDHTYHPGSLVFLLLLDHDSVANMPATMANLCWRLAVPAR